MYTVVTTDATVKKESWDNFPYILVNLFLLQVSYYCFVLFLMRKMWAKSAFYVIFLITGCSDVLLSLALVWIWIAKYVQPGPSYWMLNYLSSVASSVLFYFNLTGNLLLCFNRFTAVKFPTKYKHIWRHEHVVPLVLGTFALCLGLSYWGITGRVYYEYRQGTWMSYQNPEKAQIQRIISVVMVVLYEVFALGFSAATLLEIAIHFKNYAQKHTLAFLSSLHAVLFLWEMVYEVLSYLGFNPSFLNSCFIPFFFLTTNMNSCVILLTDREVRSIVFSVPRYIIFNVFSCFFNKHDQRKASILPLSLHRQSLSNNQFQNFVPRTLATIT